MEAKQQTEGNRLGILLIAISWVIYGLILSVPLLTSNWKLRVIIATLFYGFSHVVFWLGMLILGKKLFNRSKIINLLSRVKRTWLKENKSDE